jgi:cobalt-zinc-cadmium resistance protein CzcA
MQMPQLLTRPSLWGMAYSALPALALYALWAIPTEVLPRFDYPQISIIAHDPGAAAGEMETLIVRPHRAPRPHREVTWVMAHWRSISRS